MSTPADDIADRLRAASAWLRARRRTGQRGAAIVDAEIWVKMLQDAEEEIRTLRRAVGETRPAALTGAAP